MIQWWYADNGTQAGPMDFDALGQLMQGGKINPDTLVWHEGMGGWQAISTLPELQGLLQARTPQPRPPAPVSMPSPPVSARPAVQTAPQAAQYAPAPKQGMGTGLKIVIGLVCAFAGVFLLILVISFGYGIWKGFNDAKRADELRHAASQQQPAQTNTYAAAPANAADSHDWKNPITGQSIQIDTEWTVQSENSSSPSVVFAYTFSAENNNVALRVIGENMPSGYSLEDVVDNFRRLYAKQYQFKGQDQISSIKGFRVWESDATNPNVPGALVHMQIAIVGTHCWTLVSSRGMNDSVSESKLVTLRAQVWNTVQ
jgi:predicted lipid-binding transport protein (Tim44 family)